MQSRANCTILSVNLHLEILFSLEIEHRFFFDIVTVFCVTIEMHSEVNGN